VPELLLEEVEWHPLRAMCTAALFFDSRALDSFDQYLQNVQRYPLIEDPQEEREIAGRARESEITTKLRHPHIRMLIDSSAADG
jgi:hypothetical protein